MSITPEGKVKISIKKILRNSGAYFSMPFTGGYGSSGTPDFLVCYKGKFIGIEAKTRGNKPTQLQLKNLTEIEYAGGLAIVINEDNIDQLERIFSE
jgi:penicillin-binding protein-related factor A (putative recombinase)